MKSSKQYKQSNQDEDFTIKFTAICMHENGKLKDKIYGKLDDEIQNMSTIFFNKLKQIQ